METPKELVKLFYRIVLIGLMNFIFPFWIVSGINWSAVLLKLYYWVEVKTDFMANPVAVGLLLLIALMPLLYLGWFYYLTLQAMFKKIYTTELKQWNQKIADLISRNLLLWHKREEPGGAMENGMVIMNHFLSWVNEALRPWPRMLKWLALKLLHQIPVIDVVMTYHAADAPQKDQTTTTREIRQKLNELMESLINNYVPPWTRWIIPVNFLLLFILWMI